MVHLRAILIATLAAAATLASAARRKLRGGASGGELTAAVTDAHNDRLLQTISLEAIKDACKDQVDNCESDDECKSCTSDPESVRYCTCFIQQSAFACGASQCSR